MFAHEPPEYLPRLEYCALMAAVELFVADVSFQYSRQSFQNRARIRTPDGTQWVTVPLKGGQFGRSIGKSEVDYSQNWIRKHEKAFLFNYGSAPFFDHYMPPIGEVLRSRPETLGDLTRAILACIHRFLGLTCDLRPSGAGREESAGGGGSTEREEIGNVTPHGVRLALPDSGKKDLVAKGGDRVLLEFEPPVYRQNFPGFESSLSVLDLLFNHGPEATYILRSGIRIFVSHDSKDHHDQG
jgi:hypothetical protein